MKIRSHSSIREVRSPCPRSVLTPALAAPRRPPSLLIESNHSVAASNLVTSPAADLNSFDWMAQQNGGQFDPVLFGDYRDPQDNILNNSFGDFFNDAFPLNDFSSPYNIPDTTNQPPKKDFIKEIEVRQNSNPEQLPPTDKPEQFLTCDRLWYVPKPRTGILIN